MSPDCATCGEEIVASDQLTVRTYPDGPHPDATEPVPTATRRDGYYLHLACSDDGVQRWCRAGRPSDSPLGWIRSNGLNWTGLQGGGFDARTVLDFL